MKVTFDGLNRLITVNGGVTDLDIRVDVYSDWKEWFQESSANARYPEAIRSIGGDPTVSGQRAGDIYFLKNGWRLVIDFTVTLVTGVLFSDDFPTAYYNSSLDAQFPPSVASLVTSVEGGGASSITPGQVADAVWDEPFSDHQTTTSFGYVLDQNRFIQQQVYVNSENVSNGTGSQEAPFNNITDAIDLAELTGRTQLALIGDVQLTRSLKNLTVVGVGSPEIDLNGQDCKNTKFEGCKLVGNFINSISAVSCILKTNCFLNGFYEDCAFAGDLFAVAGAEIFMRNCASIIPGTDRPTISMNSGNFSLLSIRSYSGGLTVKDCDNIADRVTVELNSGSLTFDSSCTQGVMVARGPGKFVDETTGATVIDETIYTQDAVTKILELWQIAGLDVNNITDITDTSITVDGITITISEPDANTTRLTRS